MAPSALRKHILRDEINDQYFLMVIITEHDKHQKKKNCIKIRWERKVNKRSF